MIWYWLALTAIETDRELRLNVGATVYQVRMASTYALARDMTISCVF